MDGTEIRPLALPWHAARLLVGLEQLSHALSQRAHLIGAHPQRCMRQALHLATQAARPQIARGRGEKIAAGQGEDLAERRQRLVGGRTAQQRARHLNILGNGTVVLFEDAPFLARLDEAQQPDTLQLAHVVVRLRRRDAKRFAQLRHCHGAPPQPVENAQAQLIGHRAQLFERVDLVDLGDLIRRIIHFH